MSKKPKNPVKDKKGRVRILRGGSWFRYDYSLRSSYRNSFSPDVRSANFGFRITKNIPKDPKDKQ